MLAYSLKGYSASLEGRHGSRSRKLAGHSASILKKQRRNPK